MLLHLRPPQGLSPGGEALPQLTALRLEGTKVTTVGFEPTHPKIMELESTALDHSARLSWLHSSQAPPRCSARARSRPKMCAWHASRCAIARAAVSQVYARGSSRHQGAAARECSATLQARQPCSAARCERDSPKRDTCGIRTHAGRPHRLSRPTP